MATNNKTALITGGTSGIGLELAKLFAKDGYKLIIVARNEEELRTSADTLQSEHGVTVTTISKDLSKREAPFELYEEVGGKGVQVDVLVNNAAQGYYGEFVETDIYRELDMVQLNIGAYMTLMKLYVKEMVERGEGKILNVSSIASRVPGPLQSVYHGTKAFVQSFSQAVREEIKDTGVTITTLLPGVTDTDFFRKADMLDSKVVEGKMADPADVAKDGYDALLKGDDMIISGLKNKLQVGMGQVTPDTVLAAQMHKQQAPKGE